MAKEKKSVWEKNFAEDPKVCERVKSYLIPKMKLVRADRISMEEEWMRFFNMWNVTKDGYHSYTGRATLYIPEVRKNVEAQARQMTEAAFPSDDCFDVSRGLTGTRKGAEAWKAMHRWAMNNVHLRTKYHVAMRQEALYGTSPVYVPWKKIERHEFRSRRDPKSMKIEPKKKLIEIFNGPDFVVRDIFKWYSFNPKKLDILDDGCFEETVVGRFDLLRREKMGLLSNRKQIESSPSNAYLLEELDRDVQRAEATGIQIQSSVGYAGEANLSRDDDDDQGGRDASYLCSVIYTNMVFPEACEADEDPEMPIPLKIEIYDNQHVGLVQRNPFFHQQPPYVVGKYVLPNADEFYGQGIPKAIQYMQYEMNSKAEQAMDSATLSLNPIAIVDPGLAGSGEEFNIEPGAKWYANPQGVKFSAMPDLTQTGYAAINMIRSQMQDYSDRSPALPPELLGKARTATQSTIVSDTMGVDNKTFQLQNEQMILEPLLEMWESLIDQNMDDDQLVMILGRSASDLRRTLINKSVLLGKYRYFWKASSSMQNKQILGRQMLDFLKIITMLPPQFLTGTNLNYKDIIRILWTEGFQLNPSDADLILGQPEEMVSQDAEAENKLAAEGLEIEVLPGDDDKAHLQIHDKSLGKAKSKAEKAILMQHMMVHKRQDEMKQQQAQAQAQQLQLEVLNASRGRVGGDQSPQGTKKKSPGSGNRTQLSPNASIGNMASGVRA